MPGVRTVRASEAAIATLSRNVDLLRALEDIAEKIKPVALRKAQKIIPDFPGDAFEIVTGKDTRGVFFRLEMNDPGPQGGQQFPRRGRRGFKQSWASYLANKNQREHGWFTEAVIEVVGFHNVRLRND